MEPVQRMEEFGKGQTEGRNGWMWVIERVDFILISKKFLKDLSGKKTISYCFIITLVCVN